jgi:4-amino-4-deoxy-L-arabinose transferase-like glycosyltransferase
MHTGKLFFIILFLWVLLLVFLIISGNYEVDETTHSLVGMFFKDLLLDWVKKPTFSFKRIYDYSVSYLTYYPKVSLQYPPLPQLFFSISYLFFNESIITSRITTAFFSVLFIVLIYYITYKFYEKKEIALISCLIFITSPIIILSSIRSMQEMFFLLFFTASIFSYLMLIKKPELKWYIIFIVLTIACVLSKWNAITIFPIIFFHSLFFHKNRIKIVLLCVLVISLLLSPYYLILYKAGILFLPLGESNLFGLEGPQWYQITGWLYYIKSLVFDIFFPLIGISLLILSFYYIKQRRKGWDLFLVWIITVYVIMTIVPNKVDRRIINMLPALVIPSSFLIYKFIINRKIYIILFIILLIMQLIYSIYIIPKGIANIEKINDAIGKDGNVGIIMSKGGEGLFVFEIAKKNKFQHQIIRPCAFLDLNETPNYIIQNFNIKYIIVVWNSLDTEQLTSIAKIAEKSFPKIAEFENYSVYLNNQTIIRKNEVICNYICSTKNFMCIANKKPNEFL